MTYADLVQNALSDMYQKRKISVPIWCHDTSAEKYNQNNHLIAFVPRQEQKRNGNNKSNTTTAAATTSTTTATAATATAAASPTQDSNNDQNGNGNDIDNNGNDDSNSSVAASHDIEDDIELNTASSHYSMVTFTSEFPELVKQILGVNIGLGTKVGSMNMIPVTISKRAAYDDVDENKNNKKDVEALGATSVQNLKQHKEKERNAFFASIQSRLVVEQVVQSVRSAATFSFDYLMLVIVAAMLAAVGLASNNTVVIVASMLVSPIMGPILAITFGAMIEKRSLVWQGIINEIASLFICIAVGFVTGWIFIALDAHEEWFWPTNEMAGRGTVVGIFTGIAIATPSGVGVALSILSDNTSSLVGVAISASLLPPAVNAGMMWAWAIYIDYGHVSYQMKKGGLGIENPFPNTNTTVGMVDVNILNEMKIQMQTPSELAWAGLISLLLTLLNIAIIIVIACAMFWVKSVVKYEGEGSGWQTEYDKYKAANNIVRNDKDGKELAKRAKWVAKFAAMKGLNPKSKIKGGVCCGCGGKGSNIQPTVQGKIGGKGKRGGYVRGTTKKVKEEQRLASLMANVPLSKRKGGPNMITTDHGEQKKNNHDMTPNLNSRPMAATSIFDAPGTPVRQTTLEEEKEKTNRKMLITQMSNAITLGHKHSAALLGLEKRSNSNLGGLRQRSAATLRPKRSRSKSIAELNVGKSLWNGFRDQHDKEAEALQHAKDEFALMQHHGHNRQLTHSEHQNTVRAMETLHGAGLTPTHGDHNSVSDIFSYK